MRRGNGSRQLVSLRFVSISRLAKTDRRVCLNIREHARHNRLEDFINQRVEAELASHRQVLVILQAAAEIGELNGRARTSDASAFVRMKFLLTRIHEHAIAVGKALAAARLIWLAAIIEGYRVGPDILDAVTLLLAIVLPVIAVPVEIDFDAVFEAAPDCSARIRRRSIDDNGPAERTTAVIDPVIMS